MNANRAAQWQNDALDLIFEALAASETLTARFVYKGARVLSLLLQDSVRQSLDIDANVNVQFLEMYPDRASQCEEIRSEIAIALYSRLRGMRN